jgi:hypothetical protein
MHSYKVERNFYDWLAPLYRSAHEASGLAVPLTYAQVWNDAGTQGIIPFNYAHQVV